MIARSLYSSGLIGRTIAIDLAAKRDVFPQGPEISYYKAFAELLEEVKEVCVYFNEKAKFTFDISSENEYNAAFLYKGAREDSSDMFERFALEISFAPAKEQPRLQVADLLAFEGMKILDNIIGPVKRPKRKSWETLAAGRKFEAILYGREWFEDLKRHMAEVERVVGFSQQDYMQWLKDRNRQHNISNMVHFTNWKAERDRGKQ